MQKQRRNEAPRKSSMAGRQVRAEARRNAHTLTLNRDKTINPMGYKMPAPGPMHENGRKHVQPFKNLAEAKAHIGAVELGTAVKGLRYCSAVDMVEKAYSKEAKNGN